MKVNPMSLNASREPFNPPNGLGVRQSSAAVERRTTLQGGRGLPQSKTLSRPSEHGLNLRLSITMLLLLAMFTSRAAEITAPRERLSFDNDWRFALGHATDVSKDFNHATGGFSYFAKAGFGSGASDPKFDDRGWRKLNVPHDWAVELPFSERGSASHGFKAIGRNFPENSVGWYRKTLHLPKSDLGKRISLEFDGVFRDSIVWVNGHYLGTDPSGYSSFARNISEILNYGGDNVIVVRVDASLEEGWFYEGAGIYRHVWLVKTAPLHVERHGTFVTSELKQKSADVTARVAVYNEGTNAATFEIEQALLAPEGKAIATARQKKLKLASAARGDFTNILAVSKPQLWSIETPHLHKLVTTIRSGDTVVDQYETTFGIRSIHFDPKAGFFLNGKRVKLKGTNNHQDHAGVGAAIPDALQEFRIAALKKFGCNAYRASHNPPTPELLDACDRLGMLVIDENRLMGTTDYHYDHLRRMILRDRNHPSVVVWSVGNEEWRIEGSEQGARLTAAMQAFVKQLDATRPVTVAISGGWGHGNSVSIEAAGLNYLGNMGKGGLTTDQWHAKRPEQIIVGTEECAFNQTRGIYFDDRQECHLRAYDWDPSDWGASAEQAWSHYAERDYLAGMFVWTGFDYRGEPTPFGWPAIASQFGILDLCGFPKDAAYYFQSWWRDEPLLHIFPHWNWPGKEGEVISVWAYSNCEEVELFLNGQSLGRKTMKRNSHLEWPVKHAPGTLLARGYKGGKEVLTAKVETTGTPSTLKLTQEFPGASWTAGASKARPRFSNDAKAPSSLRSAGAVENLKADGLDVVVFSVSAVDASGRMVPTAANEIAFAIQGPGKIIGVGNGDPSSHEPDQFLEKDGSPAPIWRRSLFNGLAQIIVQSKGEGGAIKLTATAEGLASATTTLQVPSVAPPPAVP